jgi:hypothetical protein
MIFNLFSTVINAKLMSFMLKEYYNHYMFIGRQFLSKIYIVALILPWNIGQMSNISIFLDSLGTAFYTVSMIIKYVVANKLEKGASLRLWVVFFTSMSYSSGEEDF